MEKEKLVLCDLISYETKENKFCYYAIIYSNLTQNIEKVYIDKVVFEFLQENTNIDLSEYFIRSYNVYSKSFKLKYYNNL